MENRSRSTEAHKGKVDGRQPASDNTKGTNVRSNFRQGVAKGEVAVMREEYAAIKIQAGIRGFLDRQHVKRIREESKDHRSEV